MVYVGGSGQRHGRLADEDEDGVRTALLPEGTAQSKSLRFFFKRVLSER